MGVAMNDGNEHFEEYTSLQTVLYVAGRVFRRGGANGMLVWLFNRRMPDVYLCENVTNHFDLEKTLEYLTYSDMWV